MIKMFGRRTNGIARFESVQTIFCDAIIAMCIFICLLIRVQMIKVGKNVYKTIAMQ